LNKIISTLELFRERGYKTRIIITRLNFSDDVEDQQEFIRFWQKHNVLVYVKNQHNRWLYEEEEAVENTAEYLQRYCEFPWTSVSILYDGSVVPCPMDYDGALSMGNIKDNSLEEIWNGKRFEDFRKMHTDGSFPQGHFCKHNCDYKQVYEFTEQK